MKNVAALFVRADGPYPTRCAEWFDEKRDARTYAGPWPVVAHPPCKRWGKFWWADGSAKPGDDGGLFAHALKTVRRWGGVLEHPSPSYAWRHFDIPNACAGAWLRCLCGGWTTCVAQRNYGHRMQKLTLLYYFGAAPPPRLDWSPPEPPEAYLVPPRAAREHGAAFERVTAAEAEKTPEDFADLLVSIAEAA